jgi:hypothetical protein
MDDFDQLDEFERRLAGALRSDADLNVAGSEPAAVASAAIAMTGQRGVPGRSRLTVMATSLRSPLAAAAVIGVLVLGALFLIQRSQPPVVGHPSPTPVTVPSPSLPGVVAPSPTPGITAPTATPPPIRWTEASLGEDWPAPVRTEPAGSAIVPPSTTGRYTDPTGDSGSDVHPWVDIREIQFATSDMRLTLVANPPPAVDPAQRWIAYGVVVDDDRDGIPDWRLGMDNLPLAVGDGQNHRAWRTDLHTGRTTAHDPAYCCITGVVLDSFYPRTEPNARFIFGGETTAGRATGMDPDAAFYAWASVIEDGRVVATDYAPDVGWLDPDLVLPPSPVATAPSASGFPRPTGVRIATGSMGTPRSGHTAVRLLDRRGRRKRDAAIGWPRARQRSRRLRAVRPGPQVLEHDRDDVAPTRRRPGHAPARWHGPRGGWRNGHSGAVCPVRRVAAMTVASHPDPDSDLDQTTRRIR